MREILFKAKRIDNGEWIEGCLFDNGFDGKEKRYFVGTFIEKYNGTVCDKQNTTGICFCIDSETLCQFTGLCDRYGNKIWENDIVTCQTRYGGDIGKVVFHNGKFCVLWNSVYHYPRNGKCENYYDINAKNLVKGNIFDNKELLQEEHR